jgi:hypothetical protein
MTTGTIIEGDRMYSEDHHHTAGRTASGEWMVSWIPGRKFTQEQAITATRVADLLHDEGTNLGLLMQGPHWTNLVTWYDELGFVAMTAMINAFELADEK